jgi:hypothetical protein
MDSQGSKILIRVPEDVFVVDPAFWLGLLKPSMILLRQNFWEYYQLEERSNPGVFETLQTVFELTMSIEKGQLSPGLRERVLGLHSSDRKNLLGLLKVCAQLTREKPFYARVAVFSIGDIDTLMEARTWRISIPHLQRQNLLSLWPTIPSAAVELGLMALPDGPRVASALSFPRQLWSAYLVHGGDLLEHITTS